MSIRALLALAFTILAWGLAPVYIRAFSLAAGPADAMVIRYVIASVICLATLPFVGGFRVPRADWLPFAASGLVGMLGYNLGAIFGYAHISAGLGSLVLATEPLFIALLAALIGSERLTVSALIGIVVSFLGTGLLFYGDTGASQSQRELLLGGVLVLLAGVAWAVYVVVNKPLVQRHGSFKVTNLSIILASLPMLGFASPSTLPTFFKLDGAAYFALFYLVVPSTFLAAVTWNYAVGQLRPLTAGLSMYLLPLITVAAGAILLDEPVTATTLAAAAIILSGVGIAQFGDRLAGVRGIAAFAAILFAVTMWGLIPVAMRFLILDLSPRAAMVLRLYPAGLIAVTVLLFVGVRRLSWPDWGRVIIAALAGNVGYQILAAFGMQSVPASWTGLIFGLEPVFIALFAVVLAGERLTIWLVAGIGVALAGTGMLMLGAMLEPTAEVGLFGLVLVTLSTLGWGIYTVVIRPVSRKYGAFEVACLALGISALPMVFFVPHDFGATLATMTATQWLAVGFVVVFGTFLATAAWNYALGHMPSSVAGVFLYVQPVVAATGGIALLDERLTWPLAAGGALIIAGVALSQFGPRLAKQRLQTEPP